MKPFECNGLWWLPQASAAPVAGNLHISTTGDLKLSVFRGLGPSQESAGSKYHAIVLGSVSDSPLGKTITLAGCFRTGLRTGIPGGVLQEDYYAARGFFGAHLSQESDFAFRRVDLRLGGLDEWAHSLSGFGGDFFLTGKVGEQHPLLHYSVLKPVEGAITGARVTLGVAFTSGGTSRFRSFQEEVGLSITSESPKSEADLNGVYVYPLQNLMTFVCDRAQEVKRFSVQREDNFAPMAGNPEIQVIGARMQPEDDGEAADPVHWAQMLFTLEDVEGGFPDFVSRWLRVADVYSDACNIYFGLLYGPPAYIENRFLGVVQSLSLYHTRREDGIARRAEEERQLKGLLSALAADDAQWVLNHLGARPYPPFQDVLSDLLTEHKDVLNPLVSSRQAGFVNEVTNTLHYVIRRDPEVGLAASHGAALHWMTEKLRFLMKACFLREIGFSPQKIGSLFERNGLYQHVRQLEAVRAAAGKGP